MFRSESNFRPPEWTLRPTFVKVTDSADIEAYKIISTPGLVINEKVVCAGLILSPAEVTTWLVNVLETA